MAKNRVIKWRLNQVMAERRIKNKDLAERIGISPNSIYRLRREDKMPRLDHDRLDGLCEALACTPADLLIYVEES